MLIARVIASPSFMTGKKIDSTTMHRILRSVGTFDHATDELAFYKPTFPRIAKGMPTEPLQVEGLTALVESDGKGKGHSEDEEESENASIGAIPADIGPPLECSVSDAETMENVILSRLPNQAKAAQTHHDETNLVHAKLILGMASKHEFPYGPHDLATYRTPPTTAVMADQVSLRYAHASFEEKHLIHVECRWRSTV